MQEKKMTIGRNGVVTIGLEDAKIQSIATENQYHSYKLYVGGGIRTEDLVVDATTNWPDYVFEESYYLLPLNQLKEFISTHHHLPNVPSAESVEKEGINVAEMNAKLLEKVEELTLYILQQEERIKKLEEKIKE